MPALAGASCMNLVKSLREISFLAVRTSLPQALFQAKSWSSQVPYTPPPWSRRATMPAKSSLKPGTAHWSVYFSVMRCAK